MGALKLQEFMKKLERTIEKDEKDAYIKKLLKNNDVCKEICIITKKEFDIDINEDLEELREETYYMIKFSDSKQSGKVCILEKKQKESSEILQAKILQVGETIDFDYDFKKSVIKGLEGEIHRREKKSEKDINKAIKELLEGKYSEIDSRYSEQKQSGKVWILVKEKEQEETKEILQVGQAIDFEKNETKGFWGEIVKHVKEILLADSDSIYCGFANESGEYQLCFYVVDIEKYLENFAPVNYKKFIYEMAREYFVEASIAYFSQAREWGFMNSGMDKRALYYIIKNITTEKNDEKKFKRKCLK